MNNSKARTRKRKPTGLTKEQKEWKIRKTCKNCEDKVPVSLENIISFLIRNPATGSLITNYKFKCPRCSKYSAISSSDIPVDIIKRIKLQHKETKDIPLNMYSIKKFVFKRFLPK